MWFSIAFIGFIQFVISVLSSAEDPPTTCSKLCTGISEAFCLQSFDTPQETMTEKICSWTGSHHDRCVEFISGVQCSAGTTCGSCVQEKCMARFCQ